MLHMVRRYALTGITSMMMATAASGQPAAEWAAVEQALGFKGAEQPGDVFRVGMPRTDLKVTVQGIPVRAGFALGSYAAFRRMGTETMVMGDLVLLDQEVPAVMSGLLAGGLDVTAVHNHLNEMSPHVMYMHYKGHGEAVQLAKALRQALSASGTPLGSSAAPAVVGGRRSTRSRSNRYWGALGVTSAPVSFRSPCHGPSPSPPWGCPCCLRWA